MTQTQELTIITPEEIKSAGAILTQNTSWVESYRAKLEKLIAKAKAEGDKLSPETDAELDKFIVSGKTCEKTMKEKRIKITRKVSEIPKKFTAQENELLQMVATVQSYRDKSASIYAKEAREKEAEARLKLQKDQERIDLIANAEGQVRTAYSALLEDDKAELLGAFENATEDTIDSVEDLLKITNATLKVNRWDAIVPSITSSYGNDIDNIILNAKMGKFDAVSKHYSSEINNYAAYLLSLLPERREEIKAGKESAQAAKLKEEQEAAAIAQAKAAEDAAAKKAHIAAENAKADYKISVLGATEDAPKIADSYEINVLNRDGWMQLFQFYFEHSEEQDLGKIKGDQMKTFAEKMAKSDGLFIEHESIEYQEKFKAVSGRAKKVA